ncbi:MAG: DUF4838 domain-containing protein [Armatimonadia bacterium]|nr:DUF4838 domain-containing protein [Armatimonadia bacterium]
MGSSTQERRGPCEMIGVPSEGTFLSRSRRCPARNDPRTGISKKRGLPMKRILLVIALIVSTAICATCAPLTIVEDGVSEFAIVHAEDAPPSVVAAAADLQKYILEASGAELPIVTEGTEPAIILGTAAEMDPVGTPAQPLPSEGFRIVTRDGNVLIAGPDTGEGAHTPQGGTSKGTRNGVSHFLEEFVGVRWLMPTDAGDDVPESRTIIVPDLDMMDAPFFLNRRVPYTQQREPEVIEWWARQKLGWSLYLSHGHNFRRTIPQELFDEHPDWFPMFDGTRVPPTGRYKLCLSNEGLIEAFAQGAIEYFDENPAATSFSLSPSDSAGWCQCPECEKMYETDPQGNLSVTPAVLHFYNGVGEIVAEKHPDKVLAGYVYAQYVYPPEEPIELEPNVFLVWAPSMDYGYTLFRPELQETWVNLAEQWTEVTDKLAYYDLPITLSNEAGAPSPPGVEILQFLYPRLKQYNMKGVYVYGQEAWGTGAPSNYVLAKLAWDPEADVEALLDEFMQRCYHEAADEIAQMYEMLDSELKRHFLANEEARWTLTPAIMEDVYARNFSEMERLYRAAEAEISDPDAQQRLQWLGWNLTILHWNLRQYRMLEEPTLSSFYMPDADFFAWFAERKGSLALRPERRSTSAEAITEVAVSPAGEIAAAEDAEMFYLRGDQHIVILPTADATEVSFRNIAARGKLVQYSVYGADGAEISSGIMSAEVPITLDAAGSPHYHLMITAGSASFAMQVDGGAWAVSDSVDSKGLHLLNRVTPMYFEVPAGCASFRLSLQGTPPGETVAGTLYAPDGREVERFEVVQAPIDRKDIAVGPNDAGWWKLTLEDAEVGVIDDVWIDLGEGVPQWLSPVPEQALSVWEK